MSYEEEKSPPHGFQVNHEEDADMKDAEETKETLDLSILADAAANSPARDTSSESLESPAAGIPLPAELESTANGSSKPKAKKASKTKAKVDMTPKKRSTRARKLPTKLQQTPPSLSTSSSSAMSAAAILVQVSGGAEKKKKSKPRKPKAKDAATPTTPKDSPAGNISDLRGITMKRPGKWQAQFYYAGQSRYIGIFTSQEKAAQAYEIVRRMLKTDAEPPADTPREAFEISRKAAYDGVGETYPDGPKKMTPMTTPPKRKRGPQKKST